MKTNKKNSKGEMGTNGSFLKAEIKRSEKTTERKKRTSAKKPHETVKKKKMWQRNPIDLCPRIESGG